MKNYYKLVSIIIRSYNEEKMIGKLLDSIQKQNFDKNQHEVIVVDSGSKDSTLQIIQNYNVKLVKIKKENFSFGYSLNKGIKCAKGKYILIISAHCYPERTNWISKMIAPFKNNNIGLVYGRQIGIETTKYSERRIFSKLFPDNNSGIQENIFCNNANCAIRQDLWKEEHYDEILSGLEDLDWAIKIGKKGYKIYYTPSACIYHLHNETYSQIKNRYKREAIAYKKINPGENFSMIDYFKMFLLNVFTDLYFAKIEKKLFKNIGSIFAFRHNQFIGTYQGFNVTSIDSDLKRIFYYPNKIEDGKRYVPIIEFFRRIKNNVKLLFKFCKYGKHE